MSPLFQRILESRGLSSDSYSSFLNPEYCDLYDPFLMPDMEKAVDRIVLARKKQERIVIYGDYDIDGLTATALMLDAFSSFGFNNVNKYIPNRFKDGYGLSIDCIDEIAKQGVDLIITVDCGSLSEKEILFANNIGIDVIVTDHHKPADKQPPAIAVVNAKRMDSDYPFSDLAGVGAAFNLVRALQKKLKGLPSGQEKWLLDLVALGTICDVVPLIDENRILTYWGLEVLRKTKRKGLLALMKCANVKPENLSSRSVGFCLGPRMNASGRLDSAIVSLDLLICGDELVAYENAENLELLNSQRKTVQNSILKEAIAQAESFAGDKVLVVSGPNWNQGVVGIVAARLLEKFKKPTFVISELIDVAKGSARSFGGFSAVEAVRFCQDLLLSGGGHDLAAGVSLKIEDIDKFRDMVNRFYESKKLEHQETLLLPKVDSLADFNELDADLYEMINSLEPFGNGNAQPILKTNKLTVKSYRRMGSEGQHLKLELINKEGLCMQFLSFNAPDHFFKEAGSVIDVCYHLELNDWNGRKIVEGRLLHLEGHD